jgi:lipopolysaccharide export system protein LptA
MRRLLLPALLLALPAAAGAQGGGRRSCEIVFVNTPATRQLTIQLPSQKYNIFLGGGVHITCGQITLKSDSAEIYGDEGRVYLVTNVQYDEPRMHVTSDYLTYFQVDERVVAAGNVHARMANGSTMRGPQAEYRRAVPRVRTVPEMSAFARPTLNLVEKSAPGRKQPPTEVTANTLFMRGDSLVYAGGQVVITRPDLTANSDSAFLNSARETMQLIGHPALDGRKDTEDPYRLTGTLIHAWSRNRQVTRVLSMGNAEANSKDMRLTSDTIDLRVQDELLERAVAWGKGRAHAISPSQDVTADSIDVVMPRQRVRRMTALRNARAEGTPDSTRVFTRERDWLQGDTIVAHFDTLPARGPASPADTAGSPTIRQLVATGGAKSFYHLAPRDSAVKQPAINYVTGKAITVSFDNGKVQQVTVAGESHGVYLEPQQPSDSAAARPRRPGAPSDTRP